MRVPKSIYNWLSITGFILAVNSLLLILILFIISISSYESSTYLGVYTYIVLPGFLVLGLLMIPLGMFIQVRRMKDVEEDSQPWPILDMNQKKHRGTLIKVSLVTFVFLMVSAMGSYQAFHYTESVEFCGKLCHSVMEPEYVTYLNSPHARVTCVECHVGEGADWYVKSKLSGLYQVYSVMFHKYPTPIPTPIRDLRPAKETCERCHWPQKFYARKLRSQLSYLTDSANTEWSISMLMKIGPNYSAMGLREGIHWHINPDVKIEYISSTRDRETIPWVKYTNLKTGVVKIFEDEDNTLDAAGHDTLVKRTMDCMDCHNRPSHLFRMPQTYINNAMVAGDVPKELPYIKHIAMELLKDPYTSKDSALAFISDSINAFYRITQPLLFRKKKALINKAIAGIQKEYARNSFPAMRADASRYLNHIGHLESEGCFRCHNDRHKTADGETISKDCNLCHTIISQGPTGNIVKVSIADTLEFNHPVNVKNAWKTGLCSECHRRLYE